MNEHEIKFKEDKFKQFKNNFNQKNFDDPVIKNMWGLIIEFNISLKIIHDLFDGIESDIKERVKLNSRKDLLVYSYRVAGTVGLTNISRDVIEDLKNNRSYIGESFDEISSVIKLAETFYKNSFYSIKDMPMSFRFSILVARRVYRKIGYKVLNKHNLENYRNSGKIYVSNIEKTLETFLSIFDLIKLLLSDTNKDEIKHDHLLINQEINLDERI